MVCKFKYKRLYIFAIDWFYINNVVCKEGTFKKNVTCRRNFILTKWYVKSTSASLLMLFVLCFILTKWYVKNGAIVDSIDTNIILY
nr:MAG TPA_asm: hypothetical protein [Caudoviricetes sp.]